MMRTQQEKRLPHHRHGGCYQKRSTSGGLKKKKNNAEKKTQEGTDNTEGTPLHEKKVTVTDKDAKKEKHGTEIMRLSNLK